MNYVALKGRLVRDVELKATSSNINVASFTLAVDRKYKQDGQPSADFLPCIAWRNTADFISKYFHKGDAIIITGSIQTRKWTDRDGKDHNVTEIVVDDAEFCESKKKEDNNVLY